MQTKETKIKSILKKPTEIENKFIIKEIHNIKNPDILVDIIYKNFEYLNEQENLNHNIDEIKRLVTNKDFIGLFVYTTTGKIIAYLVGEKKNLNDGRYVYYITYLFVSPKYRNKKIGSQILKNLENKCKSWGIFYILLTCDVYNKKNYNFYVTKGYLADPILKNNTRHEILSKKL